MLDFEPYPGYNCDHIYSIPREIFSEYNGVKQVIATEQVCIRCGWKIVKEKV